MASWIVRADSASEDQVEAWLACETKGDFQVSRSVDAVAVDFSSIDDAFRFRLQFDEQLVR